MSEKITRVSDSISNYHTGHYHKGDLTYVKNRLISSDEDEDTTGRAGLIKNKKWKQTEEDPGSRHQVGKDTGKGMTEKKEGHLQSDKMPGHASARLNDNKETKYQNEEKHISSMNGDDTFTYGGTKTRVHHGRIRQVYRQISGNSKAYRKTSETLTNMQQKVIRASSELLKKSGRKTLNAVTLGSYHSPGRVAARKDKKEQKLRKKENMKSATASKIGRKKSRPSAIKSTLINNKLGRFMNRTVAMSRIQNSQTGTQEQVYASAGMATALAIKMVAVVLMIANIAAKLALLVVTVIVGIIVVAVSSIASVIIAIAAVVLLIAGIIGIVVSNNNDEDDGSTRVGMHTYESVYEDLEKQYEEKITSFVEIGRNAGCESYQIEGEKAEAEDVLAVYLAADTANGYGTFDADTVWFVIDANGINLLTEIYWDMNETEYFIEADENGPKKMLITAKAKDKETVAGEYNAESQLDVVSAHYFHLFNMIRNAGQDGRYVLPVGDKRY